MAPPILYYVVNGECERCGDDCLVNTGFFLEHMRVRPMLFVIMCMSGVNASFFLEHGGFADCLLFAQAYMCDEVKFMS